MQLLSLRLDGRYKGLCDQYFEFHQVQGNILALIGLNGSGKSQLLELIAEIFTFLERKQRVDFKVNTPLGFGFELIYQLSGSTIHKVGSAGMVIGAPSAVIGGVRQPKFRVEMEKKLKDPCIFLWRKETWFDIEIEQLELPHVVGYSSGLNENLQRSFMKNAVQYFEVQRIRLKRRKALSGDRCQWKRALRRWYFVRHLFIYLMLFLSKTRMAFLII